MNRLLLELSGAAVLVVGFIWHEHHLVIVGEKRCQAEDVALANKIATDNAVKEALALKKLKEAQDAYNDEIAANKAAIADLASHPRIIRVCNPASSNPVPTTAENRPSPITPAGVLPERRGENPVTNFDAEPIFSLLNKADNVVADCRRLSSSTQP